MDHNKIFCSLNMVKSIWELITIVDHHLVEHWDVGSVLWGWGHNNFLYRYAIEGVSFACKWAYRGATPGSFLSGTNISSTSLLLSLLRMLQCVTSISSFSICLHNIVLIICKELKRNCTPLSLPQNGSNLIQYLDIMLQMHITCRDCL